MKLRLLNSIYYKSLLALYKLNVDADGRAKSILIDAIFQALVIQKDGLNLAILEMALETANDDWLDYWGNMFGVPRDYQEIDDVYRKRIIIEILTPKNTLEGIKIAAARKINKDNNENLLPESIRIFEPWTKLIKLDEREYLDGEGRLISYDYWIYSVIDISLPDSSHITPALINYLNRVKAAGVKITFSIAPRWNIIKDQFWEERNTHVYNKIYREHFIDIAYVNNDAFATVPDARIDILLDDLANTILDGKAILEGKQIMFWDGVGKVREIYATGVLRNHLGGILSLEDIAKVLEKENPSLEEAYALENESFSADRQKEGRLTMTLKPIEVRTERIK
ncbi:hypothetical protein [Anaerococcus sp. Marseille-P3625]|uniref:hypothetical protein n=1 Tax=Anaerococcus sp. Marseille-P3625 TaxID=1977277 RepID=UPI000C071F93|nr:hypothetical protein [Anaerococcus sp. Marseille-P3625]